MAAEEATVEIKTILQDLLRERFENEFEFGPIVVMPRFDEYGEEYLHSYIVFNGDQKKLESDLDAQTVQPPMAAF